MPKSASKFKQELGKCCMTTATSILVLVLITSKVSTSLINISLSMELCFIAGAIVLFIIAFILMLEDTPSAKPLPGKWKRVKVKKDTTIHIEEEEG